MLNSSAPSWGPPRSVSNMSPSTWRTRSDIPASRHDLTADAGAAGQVHDRRRQSLVAPAEGHRELAVGAGHVEQRAAARRQLDRLRDRRAGELRELVLPGDVGAPVGVLGRLVVKLHRAAVPDQALRDPATTPSSGCCREEVAHVGIGLRVQPLALPRGELEAFAVELQDARHGEYFEHPQRALLAEAQALRQLLRARGPRGEFAEHPGALCDLQRTGHRHREHRQADRLGNQVEHPADPLFEIVVPDPDAHGGHPIAGGPRGARNTPATGLVRNLLKSPRKLENRYKSSLSDCALRLTAVIALSMRMEMR